VGSAAATLIAMPIALHSLGEHRFGAFLLLFGVINWVTLGNFGVHSALGRAIASGAIDAEETPAMLGASLVYSAVTTGITALAVSVGFIAWMRTAGAHLDLPRHELLVAGFAMIVLASLQIIFQAFEGVQIGQLKLYVVNLLRLLGSLFSFACLLILPRFATSMVVFVIALNGGLLVSSVVNAVFVLRQQRPVFWNIRQDFPRLRRLAVSGLAFLVIGIASLFQTHVPVLSLATLRGPVAAVDFGLLIRLLFVFTSGLSMITNPLWPAIASARAAADYAWIRKSLRLSGLLVIGVGAASFVVLALFGANLIHLWTGRNLTEPVAFQILFGIYFLQWAWSHYWGVILIGLGRERLVSAVLMIEGVTIIALGSLFAQRFGPTGMILGLVAGFAIVSGWFLPLTARRALASIRVEMSNTASATKSMALHLAEADGR
jgi:O-antigen/teichoic acid export membrane protein